MAIKMGQRLKLARKAASLSRKELAEAIGTSQTSLHRWENEGVAIPSTALIAISKATNHPIEYFLLQDDELSESKIKSTAEVAALLGAEIEAKNNKIIELEKKLKETRDALLDNIDEALSDIEKEEKKKA